MKNKIPPEMSNPDNVLARDLILNPSGSPLEWVISFRSGHFARIQSVHSTEEKRHNYFLYAPTPKGTYHDAIKYKPIDRRSTKLFLITSPAGLIRAIYHIIKQYTPDEE